MHFEGPQIVFHVKVDLCDVVIVFSLLIFWVYQPLAQSDIHVFRFLVRLFKIVSTLRLVPLYGPKRRKVHFLKMIDVTKSHLYFQYQFPRFNNRQY